MNITEKIDKFLMSESYTKTYTGKGSDDNWDIKKDGKKVLKKAMADVKKSLGLSGSKIYEGGLRYLFVEYDTFTLGWKEFSTGNGKLSVVVMTTDGDGEIFVDNSNAMITAIKSMG